MNNININSLTRSPEDDYTFYKAGSVGRMMSDTADLKPLIKEFK